MTEVYVIGSGSTRFKKWPDRSFRDLVREAVHAALSDAGNPTVEQAWVGNCAMGVWGQGNIRGQTVLSPLMQEGMIPAGTPILNVEGGCATGSLALHGAYKDIRSGEVGISLAVGVEKTFIPDDPVKSFQVFAGGIDQLHPDEWQTFFRDQAEAAGLAFRPHPARVMFLDIHALQAQRHMARYGLTAEQLAIVASKNHYHGSLNPKAQYRFEISPEKVLTDKPVITPLTRSMCSPISDGAAAVLLCSEEVLRDLPAEIQDRAVRVASSALAGGSYRDLDAPSVARRAADQAYARAGVSPEDIGVVEVHDATAFCEVLHLEMLRLCPEGEGGTYSASGATRLGGARPVNLSGGLESKGHPLGATGLGMIDELVVQLRGEAGERQAQEASGKPPRYALQHNAGGLIGWDEALCSVCILERPA